MAEGQAWVCVEQILGKRECLLCLRQGRGASGLYPEVEEGNKEAQTEGEIVSYSVQ